MKMRKLAILLLSAFLCSCGFNSVIDEDFEPAVAYEKTTDGKSIIEITISDNAVKGARSAVPIIDGGETISYSVVAKKGAETIGPVTQKVAGTDVYQLTVTPGEWVVTVTGTSDLTNEDILFGTRTIRVSDSGKYGATVTMQYIMGEGINGSVDLSVRLGSLTRYPTIVKMTISGTGTNLDTGYIPDGSGVININKADIPTGNYNAIFKFYDSLNASNSHLICVVTERISVRKNRTTKTWIKNGTETWLKDNGSGIVFELSDEIIDSIVNKTFFVKGTGGTLTATATDSNTGTWAAPFKTVQKAIDRIMAINDKSSPYTIYVDGEVKDEVLDDSKDFISVTGTDYINLKIQGFNGNNEVDIINANRVSSLPTTTTPIVENPSNSRFIEVSNTNLSSVFALTHLTLKGGSRQNGNIIMDFSPSTKIENCVICENSIKEPSNGSPIRIINSNSSKLLILKDTIIKNNYIGANSTSNEKGAVYADQLFIEGKCYIYDNYGRLYDNNIEQDTITTTQFNVYTEPYGINSFINIMGDITGSKIGVVRKLNNSVGRNDYFTFTKDFSTKCPATTKPSQIFISDQGYTIGWNSDASEAAMTVSSYTPIIQMHEDLEIRCLKSRIINPTGCGDSGRTVEFRLYSKTTGEDLTDTASWSIKPKYIGSVLQKSYCSVNGNKCIFAGSIPYEIFNITAIATAHGTTVSTTHNVQVVEMVRVSEYEGTVPAAGEKLSVSNQAEMEKIGQWNKNGNNLQNVTFVLQNDIELNDFESIGSGSSTKSSFIFDGNGHTVYIKSFNAASTQAIFNKGDSYFQVKNVILDRKPEFGDLVLNNNGAPLVYESWSSTFVNCVNRININANGKSATGLVYIFYTTSSKIENCRNEGNITNANSAGGFVNSSNAMNSGYIYNCINTGNISARNSAAGIMVSADACNFINCINTGNITGSINVGGIAGYNYILSTDSVHKGFIRNCRNSGIITGSAGNLGGIVGAIGQNDSHCSGYDVQNCVNVGEIKYSGAGSMPSTFGEIAGFVKDNTYIAYTEETLKNNFYLKKENSTLTGLGGTADVKENICAFTSNGSVSTTVQAIDVASVKYTDVVYLLNKWIELNTPPAGAPAYSKWTYDSNGLPKLMCEE